jgi:hypothetical protein
LSRWRRVLGLVLSWRLRRHRTAHEAQKAQREECCLLLIH